MNRYYYNRNKKTNKEFSINDIPKNFQCAKFFLTLHFTDFVFEWQLIKQHNLTKTQIQKFSENLNKLGLISFRLYSELSENMQEAIMKMTPDFEKIYSQNPKIYIITPEGKKAGKKIITEILKDIYANQGLYDLVQQLSQSSLNFRKLKKQIIQEEKRLIPRQVKFPNGIIIEKNTKAYINLLETKKSLKIKATSDRGNELDIIKCNLSVQDQVKEDLRKENSVYNGIFKHLTTSELETIMKPIKDKDIQLSKKEENELLNRVEELNNQGLRDVMIMQGAKISKYERKRIFDEGDRFLERLSKK